MMGLEYTFKTMIVHIYMHQAERRGLGVNSSLDEPKNKVPDAPSHPSSMPRSSDRIGGQPPRFVVRLDPQHERPTCPTIGIDIFSSFLWAGLSFLKVFRS